MDLSQLFVSQDAPTKILADMTTVLWNGFLAWWWVVVPVILFYVFTEYWIAYHKDQFVKGISWVTLELKVPRDILTTPKVMEQIFSGFAVIASTPDTWVEELMDKKIPFKEGKVPLWVSFELVSAHEGISFYIHTPKDFVKLIESQFRSQYPQMIIQEVPDYASRFDALPNAYIDTWGAALVLNEASAFPIKTYDFFESRVEEQRLDSLAPLLEVMSHLKEGEEVWVQIILRGLTKSQAAAWKTESKNKLDELLGKKVSVPETSTLAKEFAAFLIGFADVGKEFLGTLAGAAPKVADKKEDAKEGGIQSLTPGAKGKVEEVEDKLSKPVFETAIRVLYHAPKTIFDKKGMSNAIKSYFRTFTISSLNGFKEKKPEAKPLLVKWLFGGNIDFTAARGFFDDYKKRAVGDVSDEKMMEKVILSTEELATLYHFPISQIVEASRLYRLQTKTQGPPPDLPVIH